MEPHQVEWDDVETVTTVEQIDMLLDRLHGEAVANRPMLVSLDGPAGNLTIGLGHSRSFLSFVLPDNDPPYLVSSGKSKDETEVDFFMAGHHSPCLVKHLVPMETARKAVRVFAEYGALLCEVRWAEV